MNSTSEERPRRPHLFVGPVGLPLGLLFLVIALNRPTIANMRFHDLVFLLATGACLGVGLSALVRYFVFRRKG
jgi:formate-dependent nitrite reductase membrane component NrfD